MECEGSIDRPEVFFRRLHPHGARGRIVIERDFPGAKRHSQVAPEDAEKLFRLSSKVPDVRFSTATFQGMPLLLNFESANCIFVQLPISMDIGWKIYQFAEEQGFTVPTVVVNDGVRVTAFWLLQKPIRRTDFHKWYLLQQGLLLFFDDLKPYRDSLAVNTLVPLIGTVNSLNGELVGVRNFSGKILDNREAERFLWRSFGASVDNFSRHSRAMLEMLAVFHHRLFVADIPVEDWLLYFGASLGRFCTQEQVAAELTALAQSLAGSKAREYAAQIESLSHTAANDYVMHGDTRIQISFDDSNWFNTIAGRLAISQDEVDALGLDVLVPDTLEAPVKRFVLDGIRPVGSFSFIPVDRLFLRTA